MLRFFFAFSALALLAACDSPETRPASPNDRIVLVPEPDKDLREAYEAAQNQSKHVCAFLNPDTSLAGIPLRNPGLAGSVIGSRDTADGNGEYHYYSALDREMLTLTQHPGDVRHQISIFKVRYGDKADYGYRTLNIDTFRTETGIRLGVNKSQIVQRVGSCYTARDSSATRIELYYRIEQPADSRTGILKRHNMPVYYASYKLRQDRLVAFEFGFRYP